MKEVLIVEDDGFLIKFISNRLHEEGFKTDFVDNGSKALSKLKSGNYCLAVIDLIMPRMDGFALLSEIKKQGIDVPVIVYTGLSQPKDEEEVLRLGAKAFLDKTQPLETLMGLVKKYSKSD